MSDYDELSDETIFGADNPWDRPNRCERCFFFQNDGDDDEGECHKHAPIATTHPEGETSFSCFATWPIVFMSEWCGEWKPRA